MFDTRLMLPYQRISLSITAYLEGIPSANNTFMRYFNVKAVSFAFSLEFTALTAHYIVTCGSLLNNHIMLKYYPEFT